MSSNPSRLTSDHEVLVIDASVAINLLGTGRPADLLRTINRRVLMDEVALNEVTIDPFSKASGQDAMKSLMGSGLISSVQLSRSAFEMFLELTGAAAPDDLGDGEAATIAQCLDIGAVPVIDERKATRISLSLKLRHPTLHTIDILASPMVSAALSRQELGDPVFSALFHARMRVPVSCRDWIGALIGEERARVCPSLGVVRSFGPP